MKQLLPREFLSTILHSALILTVVMSLGCQRSGPERFRVQGMVNFGGQPVELGTIKFRPIEGTKAPLTGGRISEGHYDVPAVKGPLAGKYMVQIDVHEKTGRKITNMGGELVDEFGNVAPEKYSGDDSLLRAEIRKGSTQHNFELETE